MFKGVGKRGFGQGVGCSGSGPEGLSKGFEVMHFFFGFRRDFVHMTFLLLFFLLLCFFFVIDFVKHLFVAKSHLWAQSFFSHLWVTAKKKKKKKKYSGGIL